MHMLFTLIVIIGSPAKAVVSSAPETQVTCQGDFSDADLEHAKNVAKHLSELGAASFYASIARDFSLEQKLTILTPSFYRSQDGADEIPKSEADFTVAEREAFRERIANLSQLPREWRLRAVRAMLFMTDDPERATLLPTEPEIGQRVREILENHTRNVIESLVPDATEAELRRGRR